MQLTHLGQKYTASITEIATIETDTELRFMGKSFKRRVPANQPPKFPNGRLTYRGVKYEA